MRLTPAEKLKILELRRKYGITEKRLGERFHCTQATVSSVLQQMREIIPPKPDGDSGN